VGAIIQQYGEQHEDGFHGIRYQEALQHHALMELIRPDRRHLYAVTYMSINMPIPPHTDSGVCTVINCYGDTANAVTRFHQKQRDVVKQFKIANQTDGHIYDDKDLIIVDQFRAEPGDIYMLAVDQIHSVATQTEQERWAICFSTKQNIVQAQKDLA
jgi:CobQ-like glutamine amidotransferase family enzyme